MFTRLLVGLDGSPGAEAALVAAIELGRRFKSTVLLAAITRSDTEAGRAVALTDAAAGRVTGAGLGVEILHASGAVDDELLRLADQADAVVLGRRGEEHGAAGSLGDVTTRIVKRSPRPVVVAGESASLFRQPVVAYDGGTTSSNALRLAARYANAVRVPLDVVHVGAGPEAEELLARAGAYLSGEQVAFISHLLAGKVGEALPAHLKATGADVLVVGAHGGTQRRSWSVGSHTELLLRTTAVPVIVIR